MNGESLSQGKCYFDLFLKKRRQSRPKYINSKNRMHKFFLWGVGEFFFSTVWWSNDAWTHLIMNDLVTSVRKKSACTWTSKDTHHACASKLILYGKSFVLLSHAPTHPHAHTCTQTRTHVQESDTSFPRQHRKLSEKIWYDCLHDWGQSYFWNILASQQLKGYFCL